MNRDIILKIVKASGVSAGELILIHYWGEDEEKAVANHFMEAVAAMGATPVLVQQSRTMNRDIFSAAESSSFDEKYFALLSNFDAVLDIFTYQPVVLGYDIEPKQFELYRSYMGNLFEALMKCKRFAQIRIPTAANAEESGLEPADFIVRMEKAYDIDYPELAEKCRHRAEKLKNAKKLVLYTGNGCEITFELSGRSWNIDAGEGDMPCGEIYIAPIEGKTNGHVYFEKLFVEDTGVFEQVTLTVENGKITESSNDEVNSFLQELPEDAFRVVCELGFGMNPNVTEACGYTVLDEKAAGTFHIAIGNNTMFGGKNSAPFHMDFVGKGRIEIR